MRAVAWAWLVAFVLAGCASNEPSSDDSGVFSGIGQDVTVTATKGAIAGVVVDEAIRPLAGANVSIVGSQRSTVSDDGGRFAFEDLEPGAYFLAITAHRHAPTQLSATVVAGDVASVRVLLSRLTTAEPYHLTMSFRGHIDNYLGFANFAAEVLAPGTLACTCTFDFNVDANLTTVMVEAVGQVAVPNPGTPATVPGDAYWEVFVGTTADGELRDSAYEEFPLSKRFASEDTFEGHEGTLGVRITCGVWPCVTMDYDLFVTVFYHEEAPDGWSFLAGNT